jgi:hypothetical protein
MLIMEIIYWLRGLAWLFRGIMHYFGGVSWHRTRKKLKHGECGCDFRGSRSGNAARAIHTDEERMITSIFCLDLGLTFAKENDRK